MIRLVGFDGSRAGRVRSMAASQIAMLVAEGLRPALASAPLIGGGWVRITSGLGEAVSFGPPPLPISKDGVLVAQIVEIERRGEDWWGRVEMVAERVGAPEIDRELLGVSVHEVTTGPDGIDVDRVPPTTYTTTVPGNGRKVIVFNTERGWSEGRTREEAERNLGAFEVASTGSASSPWSAERISSPTQAPAAMKNRKERRTERARARRKS